MMEDLFTQRKSLHEICAVPDKIISVYSLEKHVWADSYSEPARKARKPELETIEEFQINPGPVVPYGHPAQHACPLTGPSAKTARSVRDTGYRLSLVPVSRTCSVSSPPWLLAVRMPGRSFAEGKTLPDEVSASPCIVSGRKAWRRKAARGRRGSSSSARRWWARAAEPWAWPTRAGG